MELPSSRGKTEMAPLCGWRRVWTVEGARGCFRSWSGVDRARAAGSGGTQFVGIDVRPQPDARGVSCRAGVNSAARGARRAPKVEGIARVVTVRTITPPPELFAPSGCPRPLRPPTTPPPLVLKAPDKYLDGCRTARPRIKAQAYECNWPDPLGRRRATPAVGRARTASSRPRGSSNPPTRVQLRADVHPDELRPSDPVALAWSTPTSS
jgi:hypothetical protein